MTAETNLETPRTDAVQDSLGGDCCAQAYEVVKHARTLERELAVLRTDNEAHIARCYKAEAELAAMTAERDALKKDAERLDWVALNGCGIRRTTNAKQNLLCWTPDKQELRNAIDAALAAQKPKL